MQKLVSIPLAIFLSAGALAQADLFPKLEGYYLLRSENIVDPGPDDKPDRILLSITGNSAREIFSAMDVKAKVNRCDPAVASSPDQLTKKAGNLECVGNDEKGFVCTLGVMLTTGKTTGGYVCD